MTTFSRRRSAALWTCGALGAAILFTAIRSLPPAPAPSDSDPQSFSAGRALAFHRSVFTPEQPHPIGSVAARQVEANIVRQLTTLGIEHDIQQAYVCSEYQVCGTVRNVVGRIPGATREAVLLSSHYDSVAAGPGASDDGATVAALLEIGRIVRAHPLRRDVLLLFDEGEETGLLGATAFIRKHPRAGSVVAVVNGEARGTAGRSFMFETSPGNRQLVDLFATAAPRPAMSSVFYSVYQRLPNDTDFTIFRRFNRQGLNFAFLGNVSRYHTPLDRRDLLDPGSLQHQGDNMLAACRALASGSLRETRFDATFFDVGGFFVARWPQMLNAIIGIAVLIAAIVGFGRTPGRNWWALLLLPGAMVAAAILMGAIVWALGKAGFLPGSFAAHPLPLLIAAWLVGLLAAAAGRALVMRRESALVAPLAIAYAICGLLLAWFLPGAAFHFLVPSVFLLLPLFAGKERGHETLLQALALAVSAVLFFGLLWNLYDALGNVALVLISCSVAAIGVLAPTELVLRRMEILAGSVAAFSCIVVFCFLPPWTAGSPEPLNVRAQHDDWERECRWLAENTGGALPAPLRASVKWSPYSFPTSSGGTWKTLAADRACVNEPAPDVEKGESSTDGATRILRYRLFSRRGARTLTWTFEAGAGVGDIIVNGEVVPEPSPRARRGLPKGFRRIEFKTVPAGGLLVELHLGGFQPVPGVLADSTPLVDPAAKSLLASRDQSKAVPIDEGDVSIVRRRITLGP